MTPRAFLQIAKRDALLVDQGGKTIRVTFWDEHKDLLTEEDNGKVVVAIKGVRVSDYNGRSLSTTRSSMVRSSPPCAWAPDQIIPDVITAAMRRLKSTQILEKALLFAGGTTRTAQEPRSRLSAVAAVEAAVEIRER